MGQSLAGYVAGLTAGGQGFVEELCRRLGISGRQTEAADFFEGGTFAAPVPKGAVAFEGQPQLLFRPCLISPSQKS